MYQAKETAQELLSAARRRRFLLLFTPLFFLGLSFGALQLIEPKYTSTTSILVQKEETLNPLILYEMAVNIASEDRLNAFNEIIYSRSTMEMLIDTLRLSTRLETEREKQSLIETLRKQIRTESRASDSFEISFTATDPVISRDAVLFLSNHFISTRLLLEKRRNNETVEFFTAKLEEMERVVEQQRDQVVSSASDQLQVLPMDERALQARLQGIDARLESLDWQIFQMEEQMNVVRDYLAEDPERADVRQLFRLPLDQTPFGRELSELLREYGELSQIYTSSYPRMRVVSSQIRQIAGRIPTAMESTLERLRHQRGDLAAQRNSVINDMQQAFIATQVNRSQQSDYSVYEKLYNDMKIKLEQARMTRDIGDRATEQFIVLDEPFVPEKPSSPNRTLVIALGLVAGFIVGVIVSAVAEVLDTSVRGVTDLEYRKPVIAYLSDG